MGERSKDAYRLTPDASGLKVEFHGTKVTSNAGLLAYRELDEVPGFMKVRAVAVCAKSGVERKTGRKNWPFV